MRMIVAALLALLSTPAWAEPISRCVIEVEGYPYLDGPCEFQLWDNGDFTIGVSETFPSMYFAYVFVEAGATSYWNGNPPMSHADYSLGVLTQDGACWSNEKARICAFR